MKKNGRCPKGEYYCYTNKMCKAIPAGFMVDPEGMLRKENGASVDEAARIPKKPGQPDKSDKHSDLYTDENPKGFSQRAHCAARRKRARGKTTKSKSVE